MERTIRAGMDSQTAVLLCLKLFSVYWRFNRFDFMSYLRVNISLSLKLSIGCVHLPMFFCTEQHHVFLNLCPWCRQWSSQSLLPRSFMRLFYTAFTGLLCALGGRHGNMLLCVLHMLYAVIRCHPQSALPLLYPSPRKASRLMRRVVVNLADPSWKNPIWIVFSRLEDDHGSLCPSRRKRQSQQVGSS